jgi:hypothetical protein
MADDKRQQDNLSDEERSRIGQMGGQASQSGQKGGQAQSDYSKEDTNTGIANDTTNDRSLSDEDL